MSKFTSKSSSKGQIKQIRDTKKYISDLIHWNGKRRITKQDEQTSISLMTTLEKGLYDLYGKTYGGRPQQLRIVKWILLWHSLPKEVSDNYEYEIRRIPAYNFWILNFGLVETKKEYGIGAWSSYEKGMKKMKQLFQESLDEG